MEMKISESVSFYVDKGEEETANLIFLDCFADTECCEEMISLFVTKSIDLRKNDENRILINLTTQEAIRLKNAINSHLEELKLSKLSNISENSFK